jgi:DNA topoisomerase I
VSFATDSSAAIADPIASASAAGLRYVSDDRPGLRRRRAGKGWAYRHPDGSLVRDTATLRRIKALAIPPAWTEVWICPDARGHLQATGRDGKGRKQYRYHPRWREVRDTVKYDRMLAFAEALPRIREQVDRDLAQPQLTRQRVVATVIRLLEDTLIRVGNDEYRRQNKSFGLTTLRNRHVAVDGSTIRFHFRGKHGKVHDVSITDRRLARTVKRCREIPGQELFQYLDNDGQHHSINSADVNAYLRDVSGEDFTAKDFRTWAGTVLAARFFRQIEPAVTEAETRRQVVRTIEQVASQLGNTVAVCRKCYVHPAVVEAYVAGSLAALEAVKQGMAPDAPGRSTQDVDRAGTDRAGSALTGATAGGAMPDAVGEPNPPAAHERAGLHGLSEEEQAVLALLSVASQPLPGAQASAAA